MQKPRGITPGLVAVNQRIRNGLPNHSNRAPPQNDCQAFWWVEHRGWQSWTAVADEATHRLGKPCPVPTGNTL